MDGYTVRHIVSYGFYCGMDLAADEQGLWVLWGNITSNSWKLTANKIDVYKNVITDTWILDTGKYKINLIIRLFPFKLLRIMI